MIVAALGGSAAAADWKVAVPDGWKQAQDPSVDQQLAKLRGVQSTTGAEATVYLSPDQSTQLTILHWTLEGMAGGRSGLESLNRGVTEGARETAIAGKGSDTSAFDGNELVADQTELVGTLRIRQHRKFVVDAAHRTHMVTAMCASAGVNADCERAISGLQLTIPNVVAPESSQPSARRNDIAYQAGQITGVVLVLALLGGFLWSRSKKK